jgi:hypothetical protein
MVLLPAVVPSVQLVTVATPWASVVAVLGVTDPPPVATANVTETPLRAAPSVLLTVTDGAMATAVPGAAVWLSEPGVGVTLDGVVLGSVLLQLHSRAMVAVAARASTVALD